MSFLRHSKSIGLTNVEFAVAISFTNAVGRDSALMQVRFGSQEFNAASGGDRPVAALRLKGIVAAVQRLLSVAAGI